MTARPLRPSAALWPAALWLSAGVLWFVLEGIAASAFPRYSYATNYISDLGVTVPGVVDGRIIYSPLAGVMNADFVIHGILFLAAAVLVARAAKSGWMRWLFLALAAAHAVGLVLVATFHSSAEAQSDGTIGIHVLGANLAIIGGNLTLIVAGLGAGRLGATRGFRVFSVAWGVIGLAGIAMLFADTHSAWNLLPDGFWERIGVYPMMTWEIVTAFLVIVDLMLGRPPRR